MATTKFVNRARMLTSTTGTGTSVALTTAVDGYFTLAEAGLQDGDVVDYIIEQGADFEIQHDQTYSSSGPSLSRGTPAASKVGGTAGTSQINLNGIAQVAIVAVAKSLDVNTFTEDTSPDLAADFAWVHDTSAGSRKKVLLRRLNGIIGTAVQNATGAAVDITGIPAGVKRITLMFDQISLSGTDNFIVQLGTSSGIETSGYVSSSAAIVANGANSNNGTDGFRIHSQNASRIWSGIMLIARMTGNTWISSHAIGMTNSAGASFGGGHKTLSGELDRVRLTATGTNTLDGGRVALLYE